jgi:predicted glutamine amidotransferase
VNDAANTLYYRSNSNGTAIVSEPVDENHSDWIEVPRNRVLVARAGLPIEILPFLDEKRVAAE